MHKSKKLWITGFQKITFVINNKFFLTAQNCKILAVYFDVDLLGIKFIYEYISDEFKSFKLPR